MGLGCATLTADEGPIVSPSRRFSRCRALCSRSHRSVSCMGEIGTRRRHQPSPRFC